LLEPFKVCQPELHQRAYPVINAGLSRELKRQRIAFACLRRIDALLQAIVACEERLAHPHRQIFAHSVTP
jgi:hypothetical protein